MIESKFDFKNLDFPLYHTFFPSDAPYVTRPLAVEAPSSEGGISLKLCITQIIKYSSPY